MKKSQLKQIIEEGSVERLKGYFALFPDQKNVSLNRFGWNAVHLAVEYHKLPVLKYLMEEDNVDIRHLDNAGSTLLHHALYFVSSKEEWEVVKFLLDSGRFKFDTLKDDNGNTTLHVSCFLNLYCIFIIVMRGIFYAPLKIICIFIIVITLLTDLHSPPPPPLTPLNSHNSLPSGIVPSSR